MLADIGKFLPNVSTTACSVCAHLVQLDRLWELATSNWQSGQIYRPCRFSQVSGTLCGSNLWACNIMWCRHIVGATSSGQPSNAHCFLLEMMCISDTASLHVSDSIIPTVHPPVVVYEKLPGKMARKLWAEIRSMVFLYLCLKYCAVVGKKASERKIASMTLGFVETKHNQAAAQPRG